MGPKLLARRAARAFSLVEVMVVVAIMGILLSITAPAYQRAMEQARVDLAATNLRAIWAAERCYFLEHRAYTTSFDDLVALGVLDAGFLAQDPAYVYLVTAADGVGFNATATRSGSGVYSGTLAIDQTGVVAGEVASTSGRVFRPGYQ